MPENNFPPLLYRYRPMEEDHDLNAIQEEYLWFSDKQSLNDPFEFSSKREIIMPNPIKEKGKIMSLLDQAGVSREKQVRLFLRDDFEYVLEVQKAFWEEKLEPKFLKLYEQTKVCCFTECPKNILMWGHYGNGLKGVVLGYDPVVLFGDVDNVNNGLYQVNYPEDNKVPFVDMGELLWILDEAERFEIAKKNYQTLFATKSSHWGYEREWRATSKQSKIELEPNALREVVFGQNTPEKTCQRIREVLRGQGVNFKRAEMDTDTYSLKIIDL